MVIDTTRTFKVTAKTPLGDEDFNISFINFGEIMSGRIWNEKGEIKFIDARKENDSLVWSTPIETPFETILKFNVVIYQKENQISGRVVIGDYGFVEFQGFGE